MKAPTQFGPYGRNRQEWIISTRQPMMSPARRLAHEARAERNVARLEVDKALGYQGDQDSVTIRFREPWYIGLDWGVRADEFVTDPTERERLMRDTEEP